MWIFLGLLFLGLCIFNYVRHIPWVSGLSRKCVIITGCDSGFGNALAKSLYARGVYVFAGCFTEEGAKVLREQTGERLKTVILDVRNSESIRNAYNFVKDNLPPNTVLWGLVNNAGITGETGPIELISRKDMLEVMDVHLFGMFEMVTTFLPLLKQSKGRIVNTSSLTGIVPISIMHPYVASKFAVRGFSEGLRLEKAMWGISVSTVCPGSYNTPLIDPNNFEKRFLNKVKNLDPAVHEEYGQEYFDCFKNSIMDFMPKRAKPDCSEVTRAYEHGLFAKRPYSIYNPGLDAKILWYLHYYLPKSVIEVAVYDTMRRNLPKALK